MYGKVIRIDIGLWSYNAVRVEYTTEKIKKQQQQQTYGITVEDHILDGLLK